MDLDALFLHFFATEDPSTLTQEDFSLGVERLRLGFELEREEGRKFALWTLLDGLGHAPLPADAFAKQPQLKAAAEEYLKAAFHLGRFGDPDE
ncbi:hypothetical protein [Novosphingobium aquae]|jgi:hypothetical protein|uniref:Uncharacterized protein n=1 Tax=Novosphingobium aquae TaxID=3133435 RepID=A0ABU8S334_9SPHN